MFAALSCCSFFAFGEATVSLAYDIRPPYAVKTPDGVQGLTATVAREAFSDLQIPFVWREVPFNRQLYEVKQNQRPLCALGWFKTSRREKYGQFSRAIYEDQPMVAITYATNHRLKSGETLAEVLSTNMVALVKSGYTYGPQIHRLMNQLHPQVESTTLSDRGMLRMIIRHRADYLFVAPAEAQKLLELAGAERSRVKVIHFKDPPPGNKRYLFCSFKVPPDIMSELNRWIEHHVHLQ